jgi:HK97 family phage portal protein
VFNLISKKKAVSALVPLVKAVQQLRQVTALQQYNANLGFTIYGYADQTDQINAYATVDDLYAIVNKIMKTAALIPLYEYKVVNKKAFGEFKIKQRQVAKRPTNKNIYELKALQSKAMELAGEGSPLQDFIDNPNKFQSKSEFLQLTYLFKLLTGNYYIFKDLLDAGANEGKVYEMYNLPANFTYPIASQSLPRRTEGFRFTLYNQNTVFDLREVIHGKYANPQFDFMGGELIGLSPLQAGAKTLTTIANETDYANMSLKNAGVGGVVVNKSEGVDYENKKVIEALGQLKDDVLRDLGSSFDSRGSNRNANGLGFLYGQWEFLKMTIDPANMQLLEQSKYTFKKLCNIYGTSDKLFNNDEGAKYDNYDIALRELYTNAALPLVSGLCDDFNNPINGLIQHFDGDSVVGFDITEIPELNENQADVIKRFNDAPGYKPNDLREALGYGRDLGDIGEKFVHKQGYELLDDIVNGVNINLDELGKANDYNA